MTNKELKSLRKRLGYNVSDFANKVGIERMKLTRLEKGETELTDEYITKIKQALGFETNEPRANLQVSIDYLKLTFFKANVQTIMRDVLGIEPKFFTTEPRKKHNYELWHSCGGIVLMSGRDGKQGVLLDLTSTGVIQLETHLAKNGLTLMTWLKQVLDEKFYLKHQFYERIHSTRIDIAIDEMVDEVRGNFNLAQLDQKQQASLIYTNLRNYQKISATKGEDSAGLTLMWGARGNDRLFLRFYEKRYELANKYRLSVEDVVEKYGVWNRFELEIGKEVNPYVFERYLAGDDLADIAIDLLLSKIEVYDSISISDQRIACADFYNIFAYWKKIKIVHPTNNVRLEKSMRWIAQQVVPTLKVLCELLGKQVVFDWLSSCIDETELKPHQIKQLEYERMLLNSEAAFLYFVKENYENKGC